MIGSKGRLRVENAYEYSERIELKIHRDGKLSHRSFAKRDQFAPELLYFSDCVLQNREPEPSGLEGLADVRVIEALFASLRSGLPERITEATRKNRRPTRAQEIVRPSLRASRPVHANAPSGRH